MAGGEERIAMNIYIPLNYSDPEAQNRGNHTEWGVSVYFDNKKGGLLPTLVQAYRAFHK